MKRLLTLIAVVAFTLSSFTGCGSREVEIDMEPMNEEAAAQREQMQQQMQQMMQGMPQPPQAPGVDGQPVDAQPAQ